MASSFLEDLLGKKIDENEVSAMKGSLESQLASPANGKSAQNETKQDAMSNKSTPHQANITTQPAKQGNPVQSQATNLRAGIPASRIHTPGIPVTTTVIHIAPRPSVSTAVPLAPRPNTMTVLSPGTGGRYVTTMINAADLNLLNRNVNVINASQLLGPRMMSGAVTMPGTGQVIAPRIIQQLPQRLAGVQMASPNPSNVHLNLSQDQKTGIVTLSQASVHNAISRPASVAGATSVPIVRTSLAQVRPVSAPNAVPSTIAFQVPNTRPIHLINQQASSVTSNVANSSLVKTLPSTTTANTSVITGISRPSPTFVTSKPMNSASLKPTMMHIVGSQPGSSSISNASAAPPLAKQQVKIINTQIPMEVIKEHAAKLKNFFNNLIRLASEKSPEVGPAVKDLIQKVMEGKLSEEEFANKLLTTLNSGPQPNLVGFLKKALPMLRHQAQLQAQTQQQTIHIATTTAQKLLPQPTIKASQPNGAPQQIQHAQIQHATAAQIQGALAQHKISLANQQALMQKHSVVKLTTAQQQILQRQHQLDQRRVLVATSTGSTVGTTRGIVMVQAPPGMMSTAGSKVALGMARAQTSTAASAKPHKPHAGISSSGDDDINDVTSMAGVNLMEESQRILAINSELLSSQTRSCRDELFLNNDALQKKLEALVKKHGLNNMQQDVCGLISHATQERLRDLLEKLSTISLNRPENYRDDPRYEGSLETKAQLRVFDQIDEVERKKRELREREVLMRAAKSRSRQEDPEQARLKEKAKQLQQEEEDIIRKREANNTALAAIGPRKKRKLDEALSGASASQGSTSSSAGTTFNTPQNRFGSRTQRTRRVTLKDVVFVLEQEKESTKSLFLYKALLK